MPNCVRIIAADPQPEMQQFYQEMLPRMGHRVVSIVETGQDLIRQCRDCRPDMVISDVRLQDMDAVAAAERIHQDEAVPMIILTARYPLPMAGRFAAHDILTFLIKPVTRERLAAEIPLAVRRFGACQDVLDRVYPSGNREHRT